MATSIDQQFIEYIVKSIVNKPDAVSIERRIDEKGVLLELTVDQEDLGRVIGKRGATAQSLRTLLRALGTKNDARYNLKIVDVGPPPNRDHSVGQPAADDNNSSDTPADEPAATSDEPAADEPAGDDTAKASTTDESDDEIAFAKEDEDLPEPSDNETDHSDLASRTRAELADLDDLDL